MISYSFAYPVAWSAAMGAAMGQWPHALRPWNATDHGPPATVCGWLGGSAVAGGLTVPSSPFGTSSMVVGRAPMAPTRVTSWLRRIVLPIATDGDLDDLTAWDVGERTMRFELPDSSAASRIARSRVRDVLGSSERMDDAVLAASELAANAVQHGGGPVDLQVHRSNDAIAIELTDRNAEHSPEVKRSSGFSISGRGMSIIDTLASHWGVTLRTDTKSVWCEFPL